MVENYVLGDEADVDSVAGKRLVGGEVSPVVILSTAAAVLKHGHPGGGDLPVGQRRRFPLFKLRNKPIKILL